MNHLIYSKFKNINLYKFCSIGEGLLLSDYPRRKGYSYGCGSFYGETNGDGFVSKISFNESKLLILESDLIFYWDESY